MAVTTSPHLFKMIANIIFALVMILSCANAGAPLCTDPCVMTKAIELCQGPFANYCNFTDPQKGSCKCAQNNDVVRCYSKKGLPAVKPATLLDEELDVYRTLFKTFVQLPKQSGRCPNIYGFVARTLPKIGVNPYLWKAYPDGGNDWTSLPDIVTNYSSPIDPVYTMLEGLWLGDNACTETTWDVTILQLEHTYGSPFRTKQMYH